MGDNMTKLEFWMQKYAGWAMPKKGRKMKYKKAESQGAYLEAREKSERTHDVIEAMERYARAKELIPIEWIETLKQLIS